MKSKVLNLLFAGLLVAALGIGAAAANDGGEAEAEGIGKSYITAVTPTGSTASTGNATASGESGSAGDTADNEIVGDNDNIDDTGTDLTDGATDTGEDNDISENADGEGLDDADDDAIYYSEDADAESENDEEDITGDEKDNVLDDDAGDIDTDEDAYDTDMDEDSDDSADSEDGYNYALADPYAVSTTSSDPYGIATVSDPGDSGTHTIYFLNATDMLRANYWIEANSNGFYIYAWKDSNDSGIVAMEHADGALWSYTFSESLGYTSFIILMQNSWPDTSGKSGDAWRDEEMKQTVDITVDWSQFVNGESYPLVMLGGWQDGGGYDNMALPTDGVRTYYPPTTTSDRDSDYTYFNVDFIDYLNDAQALNSNSYSKSDYNYQGSFFQVSQAPYSYLNYVLSNMSSNYTYPLYFGSLLFASNRYGSPSGMSNYTAANDKISLAKWNSTYNVAVGQYNNGGDATAGDSNTTWNAAVQGLVGSKLKNNNLTDPKSGAELPYFDASILNSAAGYNVAKEYNGYQMPFVTTKINDRVMQYSYDSKTNYALYRLEDSTKLARSYDYVYDYNGERGFFPLNTANANANDINYGFGAKITINFTINDNGTISGDPDVTGSNTSDHITFNFTGDDDVWVFIDGYLVLDMGGAHALATGSIDFCTLTADVENAVAAGAYDSLFTSGTTYENSTYGYSGGSVTSTTNSYRGIATGNFTQLPTSLGFTVGAGDGYDASTKFETVEERAAVAVGDQKVSFSSIKTEDANGNESTLDKAFDFDDPDFSTTVHTLTMFYMERGMYDSNFKLTCDITPAEKGVQISKDVDTTAVADGLQDAVEETGERETKTGVVNAESGNDDAFDYNPRTKTIKVVTFVDSGANYGKYTDGDDNYYDSSEVQYDNDSGNWYVILYTPLDSTDTYTYVDSDGTKDEEQPFNDGLASGLTDDTYVNYFKNQSGGDVFSKSDTIVVDESDNDGGNIFSYATWYKLTQNDYDDLYEVDDPDPEVVYNASKTAEFYFGRDVTDEDGNVTKTFAPSVYYLDYTNIMLVGSFSITKDWNEDDMDFLTATTDEFTYLVEIDLDGAGDGATNYDSEIYADLTYDIYGSGGKEVSTGNELGDEGTLTLKCGQTAVFKGIPVGALVTVTEQTDDTTLATGYTWREQNGAYTQSFTIDTADNGNLEQTDDGPYVDTYTGDLDELDPHECTFTNEVDRGDLTISKTVLNDQGEEPGEGDEELLDEEFTFTIKLYKEGVDTETGSPDSDSYFNTTYTCSGTGGYTGTSITFSNGTATVTLKHGQSVTITGLPAGMSYVIVEAEDADYVTYVGEVDENNEGYEADGTIVSDTGGTQASVEYFNKYNGLGSITIIKLASDGETKLGGVTFSIAYADSEDPVINNDNVTYTTLTTPSEGDDKGVIVFEKLKKGNYVITEVSTQQGYSLLKEPIYVTIPLTLTSTEVSEGNVDTSNGKQNKDGSWDFYDLVYEVVNTSNLSMPVAGNTTRNFVLVVCVVFLTGGLGYAALCGKGLLAVKAVTTIPAALDLRATRAGAYGARIVRNAGKFKKRE